MVLNRKFNHLQRFQRAMVWASVTLETELHSKLELPPVHNVKPRMTDLRDCSVKRGYAVVFFMRESPLCRRLRMASDPFAIRRYSRLASILISLGLWNPVGGTAGAPARRLQVPLANQDWCPR